MVAHSTPEGKKPRSAGAAKATPGVIVKTMRAGKAVSGRAHFTGSIKPKASNPQINFWLWAHAISGLTERERMERISNGYQAVWLSLAREAFGLSKASIAELAHISTATFDRRVKSNEPLDQVASERLDRLAQIAVTAEDVFEDKDVASKWMSMPNQSLGGATPLSLCETELGARQVRRVLHAIEWGGVV